MSVHFHIVGSDLPGTTCAGSPDQPRGYENIHVGLQRGKEAVDLAPGDATTVVFDFDVPIRGGRFSGPFIHGRDGQRFLYLSWGELTADGFGMFRRAKIHLDALDPAAVDGHLVKGTLALTDERGHPVCASLRPPRITWTVR